MPKKCDYKLKLMKFHVLVLYTLYQWILFTKTICLKQNIKWTKQMLSKFMQWSDDGKHIYIKFNWDFNSLITIYTDILKIHWNE